jgi:hypothetical protein
MTGFSRIINISKALRKIDLEKCERIGFGGNGAVYSVSEDEIVKVNYNPDTYEGLDKELTKAKEAFLLGIPTAISFDTVDCGDGKRGVVYEIIKNRTLGETMQAEPERIEELTEQYVAQLNRLHATRSIVRRNSGLHSEYFNNVWIVEHIRRTFDSKEIALFRAIIAEGKQQGLFTVESPDLAARFLHFCLNGLEVPFIKGVINKHKDEEFVTYFSEKIILSALGAKIPQQDKA